MRLMCVNYFKVTLILAFPAIIKVEASAPHQKLPLKLNSNKNLQLKQTLHK